MTWWWPRRSRCTFSRRAMRSSPPADGTTGLAARARGRRRPGRARSDDSRRVGSRSLPPSLCVASSVRCPDRHADRADLRRRSPCEASRPAPTTTCPSRSARARWWRVCRRCCDGPAAGLAAAAPAARRRARGGRAAPHRADGGAAGVAHADGAASARNALVRHPGRTFTREELVSRAFGPDYDGLDRTVDTHITNLRRKLEPGRTPRYVVTVHGIGYCMPLVSPGGADDV